MVTLEICSFRNCQAPLGGAVYTHGVNTAVSMFSNNFRGNVANDATTGPSGGNDIYKQGGNVSLYSTCPNPFETNTPTQGNSLDTFSEVNATGPHAILGSLHSYSECDYWKVTTMDELFNKVSNNLLLGGSRGNAIIENGDVVKVRNAQAADHF